MLWVGAALLAAGAIAYAFRPVPLRVESAIVERRTIETSVESEAKTRIHDRYALSAQVSGRLLRVTVEEGDRVRAGERIASIDPLPYTVAVTTALARVRELEADLAGVETLRPKEEALAQVRSRALASKSLDASAHLRVRVLQAAAAQSLRDLARLRDLADKGYLSRAAYEQAQLTATTRQRELEIAKTDATAADHQLRADRAAADELARRVSDPDYLRNVYGAQIAAVRAELHNLEDRNRRTGVVAPVAGEVLRVLQKSESYVQAGTPIVEIGDRNGIEVVADVLSQDAVAIRPGNRVEIVSGAGDAHPWGTVRRVEPAGYTKISALGIEEQRVNVIATFPGSLRSLGDAYRLDVRIVTTSAEGIAVPVPALVRCDEAWCAFRIENGRARRVTVGIGRLGAELAEVRTGLAVGDRVILRPPESLQDGTRVVIR